MTRVALSATTAGVWSAGVWPAGVWSAGVWSVLSGQEPGVGFNVNDKHESI